MVFCVLSGFLFGYLTRYILVFNDFLNLGVDTSPTGTLDSEDMKDSKYGSSSTMSVGSEASPTLEKKKRGKRGLA